MCFSMKRKENSQSTPFSLEGDVEEIAENLIGAILITNEGQFVITGTRAYPKELITRSEFQKAKNSKIGTVTGSPYRGRQTFVNISTSGNCLVMPTSVLKIGEVPEAIEGSSRVAKALGVKQGLQYGIEIKDPHSKILYLTTINS